MHEFNNHSPYRRSPVWRRVGEETIFFKWIKMKNKTYEQVAELTGTSARSVKYWASGQALPSLLSAFRIEQITQGKVPVASWLGTALAKAKWNNPHVPVRGEKRE